MGGLKLDRISILVADDSEHMRRLIRALLRAFGCNDVREAANGEEALRLIHARTPDILLTNWNMAPMDGIALTQAVRNAEESPDPFLPVIMITSYCDRRRVFEARDAGITELLVKPLSARTLFSRLQAVIERPRRFVRTKTFFGPDRRRLKNAAYDGPERRGGAPSQDDILMTQGEINDLFNPPEAD